MNQKINRFLIDNQNEIGYIMSLLEKQININGYKITDKEKLFKHLVKVIIKTSEI